MQPALRITADWEHLDEGTPEERAGFAGIGIAFNNIWLTEGRDGLVNRIRTTPLLSAYHMAEWLCWNWWRLRWEPRSNAPDWDLAHRMTTIGEGYVWPNITIFSDGERTALIAKPSTNQAGAPFRYISDCAAVMPSIVFERAVDEYISQVLGQLHAEQIRGTNLGKVWSELTAERQDGDARRRRKLEALLGNDPDEADPTIIDGLLKDARVLGARPMEELAADRGRGGELLVGDDLRRLAGSQGFDASPNDAARLDARGLTSPRESPAWRLGAEAARVLRGRESLGDGPIANAKLAELAGVTVEALSGGERGPSLSFALDDAVGGSRVVLRSAWPTGRRFELARLLADRIVAPTSDRLHPATRADTYRQKMQRSFAAELLSPFEAVDAMLAGDYSGEAQQDAAAHFQVSDLTIRTLLVNHRRLDREELDEDFGAAA